MFINLRELFRRIDKYYDQLNRNSVNTSPQSYGSIALIIATAIVFSVALLFHFIFVIERVNAQNDSTSSASNETSMDQKILQAANEGETYIVTLKNQSSSADLDDIMKAVEAKGGNVTHVYTHSINGFSVKIPSDKQTETIDSLVNDTRVKSIEPDQTMSLPTPLK